MCLQKDEADLSLMHELEHRFFILFGFLLASFSSNVRSVFIIVPKVILEV